MPDWIADKKRRAERIREAKAELDAEAKAAAEAQLKAAAEAQERRDAEGRRKGGRKAAPSTTSSSWPRGGVCPKRCRWPLEQANGRAK
jgi:septal ring factor EnvC (AmiA/AmiB activator)